MTPHELRATLDRLDLSAAEAGHLLGVHRATIYRWFDGSMSVPIVVELLLRLMVRRGIRSMSRSASPERTCRLRSARPRLCACLTTTRRGHLRWPDATPHH
jgi:predicted transcriptional regulator